MKAFLLVIQGVVAIYEFVKTCKEAIGKLSKKK